MNNALVAYGGGQHTTWVSLTVYMAVCPDDVLASNAPQGAAAAQVQQVEKLLSFLPCLIKKKLNVEEWQ